MEGGRGGKRVIRHSIGSTANNGTYYVRRELDSAHPPEQWYVILLRPT